MKIAAFIALSLWSIAGCADSIRFHPKPEIEAIFVINGSSVKIKVAEGSVCREQEITIETEKPLNVALDDYNFDGALDLSVWSVDEGKGTYEIHHPFLFDEKSLAFQGVRPACGDEFLNLRVDRRSKLLLSTYFSESRQLICKTRPVPQLSTLKIRDCQ